MTDLFSKIKEVTELDGIAGYEHSVRDYLRTKITPLVDRVETDGLGGIFGIRDSKAEKAPRILVAAHMDEVGFMVSDIKVDGTLRVVGTHLLSVHNGLPFTHALAKLFPLFQDRYLPIFYVGQMALLVYHISKILCLMVALRIRQKLKDLVLHRVILLSLNLKRS